MSDNFDEKNLEFISEPFGTSSKAEYAMFCKSFPCKVVPSIKSMQKTVKSLLE